MIEFTASHFTDLCRDGPVREQISSIEERRRSAVGKFWLYGLGGLALSAAIGFAAGAAVNATVGFIAFFALLVGTIVVATAPLGKAGRELKLPVLESLAAQGGMSYHSDGFEPPVFGEAQQPLFGGWLSGAVFTDLFHGEDGEGRKFAVYEATLTKGHGKHKAQVFSGQVYAFQRRGGGSGASVAVPDRGIFNFFKPSGGYQRVKLDNAADFEKKFEVYSTYPQAAAMLFGSTALRALLLDLRQSGRVFVYAGPGDALVAVTGKNRFEPGSMFRSRGGEERVRLMFDDVCASLEILRKLKEALD